MSNTSNTQDNDRAPNILGQRPIRTKSEKDRSRTEAAIVLRALFAERVGGVVGRSTAGEAGARVGRLLGNERIVRSLGFVVLDEVLDGIFGVAV